VFHINIDAFTSTLEAKPPLESVFATSEVKVTHWVDGTEHWLIIMSQQYGLVNKSGAQGSRDEQEDAHMSATSGPDMPLLTEDFDSYGGKANPFDQRGDTGGYNAPQAPYPSGGRGNYNMPSPGQEQYNGGYSSPAMGRDGYGEKRVIVSSDL
jgi:hypothetical protein